MASPDRLDLRRGDFNLVYRPQREWIDGRGLLIVVAHFFSGVGAGAWLFSALFGFRAGMWMALVTVAVLSGIAHLLFLGRMERVWRILKRPHRSWISRGIWGIGIFMIGALGYLSPWTQPGTQAIFLVLSLVGVVAILCYEGFVYRASVGIAFWRNYTLPLLYIAYGLRGGAALLLIAAALGGASFDVNAMEVIKLWVVVSTAVLILLYLALASRSGGAARSSVHELVAGRISPAFYGGTIAVGILIPVALGLARELGTLGMLALGTIGVASLIGDFFVKYCVVKAGAYRPLQGAGIPRVE